MNVVFFGTSEFAVPALRAIVAAGHRVSLVVTQPDRPSGRGRKLTPPPVKEAAAALALPVTQPEKVNTQAFRDMLTATGLDVVVLVSFGQLLKSKLLALPRHGCINVHGSILPRHRGASPIQAAILAGDRRTGVTIMRMNEGLDTGPIALTMDLEIAPHETAAELHDRLALLGAEAIVSALAALERDALPFTPQPEEGVTLCSLIAKEDGDLDFAADAAVIDRRIRAMTSWPGAHVDLVRGAERVRWQITRARPVACDGEDAAPGTIVRVTKEAITVRAKDGAIEILELKPAGKRAMSVADYQNGAPVSVGERLECPLRGGDGA